jgi:hypothetical protein
MPSFALAFRYNQGRDEAHPYRTMRLQYRLRFAALVTSIQIFLRRLSESRSFRLQRLSWAKRDASRTLPLIPQEASSVK